MCSQFVSFFGFLSHVKKIILSIPDPIHQDQYSVSFLLTTQAILVIWVVILILLEL